MANSTDKVCKALKLKAQPKAHALSIKLGLKKFGLPFETRILSSDQYMFIHVLPDAKVFRVDAGKLIEVSDEAEARAAQKTFRKSRKGGQRREKSVPEVPEELKAALTKLPPGYKIAIDRNGQVRMVKARPRKK